MDFGNGGERDVVHRSYAVVAVTMIHPFLDIALLRIETAPDIAWLPLRAQDPGTLEGREVAVIGYPQFDQRYGLELQKVVLSEEPGVKRVMPGKVAQIR